MIYLLLLDELITNKFLPNILTLRMATGRVDRQPARKKSMGRVEYWLTKKKKNKSLLFLSFRYSFTFFLEFLSQQVNRCPSSTHNIKLLSLSNVSSSARTPTPSSLWLTTNKVPQFHPPILAKLVLFSLFWVFSFGFCFASALFLGLWDCMCLVLWFQ